MKTSKTKNNLRRMEKTPLSTARKSLVLCRMQDKKSSVGQATAIVLTVIVKAHSLEDERTLRDSRRRI